MAMKRFNSLSRDDIERIVAKRKTHGYLSLLLDKGPFPESLLPVAMKEGARALPTYEDLRRWLEEIKSGKMSKKEAALFAKVISFLLPDIDEPGDFDAAGYLIVLRSAAGFPDGDPSEEALAKWATSALREISAIETQRKLRFENISLSKDELLALRECYERRSLKLMSGEDKRRYEIVLEKLAFLGDPSSYLELGRGYAENSRRLALARDETKALRFFEKASLHGLAEAEADAGRLLLDSKRKDAKALAYRHLATANIRGSIRGSYLLFDCYNDGIFVKRDSKTALSIAKKAYERLLGPGFDAESLSSLNLLQKICVRLSKSEGPRGPSFASNFFLADRVVSLILERDPENPEAKATHEDLQEAMALLPKGVYFRCDREFKLPYRLSYEEMVGLFGHLGMFGIMSGSEFVGARPSVNFFGLKSHSSVVFDIGFPDGKKRFLPLPGANELLFTDRSMFVAELNRPLNKDFPRTGGKLLLNGNSIRIAIGSDAYEVGSLVLVAFSADNGCWEIPKSLPEHPLPSLRGAKPNEKAKSDLISFVEDPLLGEMMESPYRLIFENLTLRYGSADFYYIRKDIRPMYCLYMVEPWKLVITLETASESALEEVKRRLDPLFRHLVDTRGIDTDAASFAASVKSEVNDLLRPDNKA